MLLAAYIIGIIIGILLVHSLGCRYVSAYYKSAYIKKHITIKNDWLAILLIAEGYGRCEHTDPEDRNKMSFVGILSYIYFFITLMLSVLCILFFRNVNIVMISEILFALDVPFAMLGMVFNNWEFYANRKRDDNPYDIEKSDLSDLLGAIFFIILLLICVGKGIYEIVKCIGKL